MVENTADRIIAGLNEAIEYAQNNTNPPKGWLNSNPQLNALIAASGHSRDDAALILRNLYEAGWSIVPRFLTAETDKC